MVGSAAAVGLSLVVDGSYLSLRVATAKCADECMCVKILTNESSCVRVLSLISWRLLGWVTWRWLMVLFVVI